MIHVNLKNFKNGHLLLSLKKLLFTYVQKIQKIKNKNLSML